MTFKKLKELPRLSPEQKQFVDSFYQYLPLTHSESSMNLLCKYIEGVNFEISQKIKISDENIDLLSFYKNKAHNYTQDEFDNIISVLKIHIGKIRFNKLLPDDSSDDTGFDENTMVEYNLDNDTLERAINEVCSDVYLVTNCLLDYFYKIKPSSNKDILWSIYGKYIFNNIKENTLNKPQFPFPNPKGDITYWNKQYSLKEINI
jgi:hypothetical protein